MDDMAAQAEYLLRAILELIDKCDDSVTDEENKDRPYWAHQDLVTGRKETQYPRSSNSRLYSPPMTTSAKGYRAGSRFTDLDSRPSTPREGALKKMELKL